MKSEQDIKDREAYGVDAFSRMSRHDKRKVIVSFQNRSMTVLEYIDKVNSMLPRCVTEDKKAVNHVVNMRSLYMKGGIKAIQKYIDLVTSSADVKEDDSH
jgi:hypothetical protein